MGLSVCMGGYDRPFFSCPWLGIRVPGCVVFGVKLAGLWVGGSRLRSGVFLGLGVAPLCVFRALIVGSCFII